MVPATKSEMTFLFLAGIVYIVACYFLFVH